MDQVRAIVGAIWQQRFWVLSILGTSVAVACWFLAAGDLQEKFSTRIGAISGQFTSVEGLSNEPFHPNEKVINADRDQAVQQKQAVYQVWSDLYERQHTQVLYWPKDGVLGEDFAEHMKGRRFRDPISNDMRDRYWNYIQKRFDALLKIVDARKIEGAGLAGGRRFGGGEYGGGEYGGGEYGGAAYDRTGAGAAVEEDYLVEWLDQGALQAQLSFPNKPTATQIWVTQEDLWVYETLLNVIANTNKQRGATHPSNTAVREIVNLEVGKPAIATRKPLGKIYMPQAPGLGGEGGMSREYGEGGGEYGGYGAEGGMSRDYGEGGGEYGGYGGGYGAEGGLGGTAVVSDEVLLANRYLDPAGEPLTADAIGSEYRQLPVHLVLKMDQRWIPPVLIECANAPLPVEVKWVRVNPEKARSALGGNASSMMRGGEYSRDGLPGVPNDDNLVTVEIQGVVLIYGQPNVDMLTVPGAEEAGEADSELASAPPATL